MRSTRPSRSRWTRGGPRSAPRSCAGRARGIEPAGSRRCSTRTSLPDPDQVVHGFERDVERLRGMEAEAAELAPELAGSPAFRDPADMAARRGAPAAGPERCGASAGAVPDLAAGRPHRRRRRPGSASRRRASWWRSRVGATTRSSWSARSGAGKTHLLHAVGNLLVRAVPRPGGLSQRARVHRRADRRDRPRHGGRLARSATAAASRCCSTTCTSSARRTVPRRSSSCSSTSWSSRAASSSSPRRRRPRPSPGWSRDSARDWKAGWWWSFPRPTPRCARRSSRGS